ncbi:MAG: hypothetical protein WC796_01225 [Candidatus Pacearchaeota archaeon]|jgi:hypothetical protein
METTLTYRVKDAGMIILEEGNPARGYSRSYLTFIQPPAKHSFEQRHYPQELRKLSLEETLGRARDEDGIILSSDGRVLVKVSDVSYRAKEGLHGELLSFQEFIEKGRPLSFAETREFIFPKTEAK